MREGSFERVDLERFLGPNTKVLALINDPFYKNEANYFINRNWLSVKIANDFFIENHNFSIIQKLMKLNSEDYFLLTYPCPPKEAIYYKVPFNVRISKIRKFIKNGFYWTNDWYFISISMKWAGISVYDDSALYIGYDKIYDSDLKELFENNSDFVEYL